LESVYKTRGQTERFPVFRYQPHHLGGVLFRSLSRHNYVMSVRTTIDIPEDLYETLRRRAASEQTSIRSLVIGAMERKFGSRRRTPVIEPPVPGTGKPGPLCPDKENPYDLLFS
jgi:hypothetical protein